MSASELTTWTEYLGEVAEDLECEVDTIKLIRQRWEVAQALQDAIKEYRKTDIKSKRLRE